MCTLQEGDGPHLHEARVFALRPPLPPQERGRRPGYQQPRALAPSVGDSSHTTEG